MNDTKMKLVEGILKAICAVTEDAPFIFSVCLPGDEMHMISNMNAEGVNQFLYSCKKQAEIKLREGKDSQ